MQREISNVNFAEAAKQRRQLGSMTGLAGSGLGNYGVDEYNIIITVPFVGLLHL